MNNEIENRFQTMIKQYPIEEITAIFDILSLFIEHPTKPGYKRKDIELFLNKIKNYNFESFVINGINTKVDKVVENVRKKTFTKKSNRY